jgi:hypothetical protein
MVSAEDVVGSWFHIFTLSDIGGALLHRLRGQRRGFPLEMSALRQ